MSDQWINDACEAEERFYLDELEREATFVAMLKLAADVPAALRACDVDRVLSDATARCCLAEFKHWLRKRVINPDTIKAIEEWKPHES